MRHHHKVQRSTLGIHIINFYRKTINKNNPTIMSYFQANKNEWHHKTIWKGSIYKFNCTKLLELTRSYWRVVYASKKLKGWWKQATFQRKKVIWFKEWWRAFTMFHQRMSKHFAPKVSLHINQVSVTCTLTDQISWEQSIRLEYDFICNLTNLTHEPYLFL